MRRNILVAVTRPMSLLSGYGANSNHSQYVNDLNGVVCNKLGSTGDCLCKYI